MKNMKKQNGYSILSVILTIVVIIVSIGAWTLSGTTNANTSSSADVTVSTIISQGATLQLEYDRLKIQGYKPDNGSSTQIAYLPGEDIPGNILNPTTGIEQPIVPPKAIRENPTAQEGIWIYEFFGLQANGIGTSGDPLISSDQAMLIIGVKDSVCQRINQNINGISTIPSLASGYTFNNIINKNFPMHNGLINLTSVTATKYWKSGCISIAPGTPDKNMFFKILQAN